MADRRTSILEAACRVIARRGVRGLRIDELAADAHVSEALIYYYFDDRSDLLRRTLEFVNERAGRYTDLSVAGDLTARETLERMLLLEFQHDPTVVENSTAWGEFRASAVFDADLQKQLRASTASWIRDVSAAVRLALKGVGGSEKVDAVAAAERLTSLVEGLSERWLSGSMSLERAREHVRSAVAMELEGNRSQTAEPGESHTRIACP